MVAFENRRHVRRFFFKSFIMAGKKRKMLWSMSGVNPEYFSRYIDDERSSEIECKQRSYVSDIPCKVKSNIAANVSISLVCKGS
jgi:hypothetical protein